MSSLDTERTGKMSTKVYRVAVLGSQDGGIPMVQCTLRLFDLGCEEVCSLLETVDHTGSAECKDADLKVAMSYKIQGGGRLFPPVSRKMVAEAMKGVELLVAVVSSNQLNWIYWEVFECMIEDNLMDSCIVVLKLVDSPTPGAGPGRGTITADNAPQNCGLIGDKWRGTAHVIADTGLGGKGVTRGIAELRAALRTAELSTSVTRPVRETVSASKTILKAGHTFVRWLKR